jgi:hypothetical protein
LGCDQVEFLAVVEPQIAKGSVAEPDRSLQNAVEYRRQITLRRIDDLQDLGDGGLVLPRLFQFTASSVQERRKAFLPIRKVRAISQKLYSHSQPRNPHSV